MATVARPVVLSAIVGTAVVLAVLPRTHERVTTYSASPRLAAADTVAALAMLGACGVGLLFEPRRPGLVALALAMLAWAVQDWASWYDGPRVAPSLGIVFAPLLVPLLVHTVLAAAGRHRQLRVLLVALYVAAGTMALVYASFYDPFLEPNCGSTCLVTNVLLLTARPSIVETVAAAWLLVTAVAGLGLAAVAIRGGAAGSPAARRVRGPSLAAALLLGGVLLAQSMDRWRHPRVDPTTSPDSALYPALVVALVFVAASWAYGPLLDIWTRRGVADLVRGLGSAAEAGTVARVIAAATGDPSVQLMYRLPSSGGYADAAGSPVGTAPLGPGTLPVLRDGQELAVVLHDPEISSIDSIKATIGTALMLALDNERLRSEALAQLADLRASRARVVEAGDAERRQIERNLHDGAQQRMLALSFDLRRAVGHAETPEAGAVLASAETEARTALAELRDLAHGIYPAVLEESGLSPALGTLADAAPVPVEVCEDLAARLPSRVERTAYVVVRDVVAVAAATGSRGLEVTISLVAGNLVVEVLGAGPGPFVPVEDRVAGAGGHVQVEPNRVRAVIPCES